MTRTELGLRHFVPLAGFVVPTLVIGYGFVIPRSCIAGWNELSVGFGVTVASACITYAAGLRLMARVAEKRDGEV
jgi:ABC-type Fe3+ transport system permease subunit